MKNTLIDFTNVYVKGKIFKAFSKEFVIIRYKSSMSLTHEVLV